MRVLVKNHQFNGAQQLPSYLRFDPSLNGRPTKKCWKILIAAAFNDAVRRAEELQKEKNGFCNRRHAITSRNETSILIHRVCEFIDSHTIHFLPS